MTSAPIKTFQNDIPAHTDLVAPTPVIRKRRLRQNGMFRAMVRETTLSANDFILPLFVEEEVTERAPISSLPGVFRESETTLADAVTAAAAGGVKAMMLFGVSHHKDARGGDSLHDKGLFARMIDRAKQASPETLIVADLCFCEYTDHGHCGPLTAKGDVDNDATLENLMRQARVAAEAGADMVAPSGMMDGMVAAIREGLDESGYSHIPIMSYAAKFASCFYGPFRDAAGCGLGKGNRKTYQMDPANGREAIEEALQDEAEGADVLMVKPGMPYLDVLARMRMETNLPLAVYQVSGEYAMIKAAAAQGMLNEKDAMMESLLAFKRAGADIILSYYAADAIRNIKDGFFENA
ncbi:MAG: porphobilinogen synthase [Rhodospirillales bacterium]|nr:porphobilinogen synthase [Rhodospirillales bacterium]